MNSSSDPCRSSSHLQRRQVFEAIRFIGVSATNTVATYLLYICLLRFCDYRIAYSLSYVAGIIISYVLNASIVFRRRMAWSSAVRFPLVYVIQYIVGFLILGLLVERAGIRPPIAAVAVVICTVPLTFFLSRYVLRAGPERP